MSAYDDSYEMYDLERQYPNANYSELRRLLREKHRKEAEEYRKKEEVDLAKEHDRCPTSGRDLQEEAAAFEEQDGVLGQTLTPVELETDPVTGDPLLKGVLKGRGGSDGVFYKSMKTGNLR